MLTNAELVKSALNAPNGSAFSPIVLRFEKLVWATIWGVVRDYHTTQDLTQDTFLVAHQKLGELRAPEALASWLVQIAKRKALEHQRLRRRDFPMPVSGTCEEQSMTSVDTESLELLEAIAALPEQEKSVVVLKYIEGHSNQEIAIALERSVGTVSKQLSRAMERLREQLQRQARLDQALCEKGKAP